MISFVTMNASDFAGTVQLPYTGTIAVPANGRVSIDQRDVPVALAMGMNYVRSVSRYQAVPGAPAAASGTLIVNSTNLANGTLTIAAQPVEPRVLALQVDTGTSAITAGNCAVAYVGNDGVTHTDNISLIAPASSLVTTNSTYGVVKANSVIVTNLAGGASPKVQLGTTNAFAMQVDPGFTGFAVIRENEDGVSATGGTVNSTAASITPAAAPNGTHTYGFWYNFQAPDL